METTGTGKTVLFVNHTDGLMGAEQVGLDVIGEIVRRGGRVIVCVPKSPKCGDEEEKTFAAHALRRGAERVVRLGYRNAMKRWKMWWVAVLWNRPAIGQMKRIIRQENVDVVISNTYICTAGLVAARETGVRHVWYLHEPTSRDFWWREEKTGLYRRLFGYKRNETVFISAWQAEGWKRAIGERFFGRSRVIYNPVKAFVHRERERHEGVVFGFLGQLHERKNVGTLIAAFGALVRNHAAEKMSLVIGGEGPDEARLKADVAQRGLADTVTFCGFVGDVGAFYARVDVLVLPSWAETMPLVAVEAMTAGCAVIMTRESGLAERVTPGEDLETFDPGNVAELTEKMARMTRREVREEMARRGCETLGRQDVNAQFGQAVAAVVFGNNEDMKR